MFIIVTFKCKTKEKCFLIYLLFTFSLFYVLKKKRSEKFIILAVAYADLNLIWFHSNLEDPYLFHILLNEKQSRETERKERHHVPLFSKSKL